MKNATAPKSDGTLLLPELPTMDENHLEFMAYYPGEEDAPGIMYVTDNRTKPPAILTYTVPPWMMFIAHHVACSIVANMMKELGVTTSKTGSRKKPSHARKERKAAVV